MMEMLDMNDPDFVTKLKKANGLGDGETAEFVTPQFERDDGVMPCEVGEYTFSFLAQLSPDQRTALGMCRWDEPRADGTSLWLFPYQWLNRVPNGFLVESICGRAMAFDSATADRDRRFGMLSFGIRAPA